MGLCLARTLVESPHRLVERLFPKQDFEIYVLRVFHGKASKDFINVCFLWSFASLSWSSLVCSRVLLWMTEVAESRLQVTFCFACGLFFQHAISWPEAWMQTLLGPHPFVLRNWKWFVISWCVSQSHASSCLGKCLFSAWSILHYLLVAAVAGVP